ncbi:MAG: dihydrofolate reductase [Devosia nanyangense]|uniref:Dihydrofolate reductase n=1 Tax=Devosia nanyangense TaxID=1228055 RepID=A0A933NWZ5_9HYPH|nr:dihydrofolate reductase [Devosia nanyangense]
MARIVGYIASSLDGFIADPNESLDWLTEPTNVDLGEHHYDLFIKRIRTVVMGRATYDWILRSGAAWPYGEQRCIVVTSRPLADPPAAIETRSDVDALIAELRGLDDGDVWMAGGGRLQMAFLERGALDEVEVYIASAIIGGGSPLFPPTGFKGKPRLISAKAFGEGMARLHYRFD